MKYLGIDYGAKRIGLAVSNEEGTIAFPHSTIANDAQAIEHIASIVRKKSIHAIVMGDTRSHGGHANPITEDAEHFAKKLGEHTGKKVELVFEAWSSMEASRSEEKNAHDDAAAAAFILQRHMDMRGVQ